MEYVITLFAAFGLEAKVVDVDVVKVPTLTRYEYTQAQEIKATYEEEVISSNIPAVYVIVEQVEPPTK